MLRVEEEWHATSPENLCYHLYQPMFQHPGSRAFTLRSFAPLRVEQVASIDSTNAELMRRPQLWGAADETGGGSQGATESGTAPMASGTGNAGATQTHDNPCPWVPTWGGIATQPEAVWLIAEEQTAGRGRRGKQWRSQPGGALLASYGRELPPGKLHLLGNVPLVAGIVIAEYMDTLGVGLGLKWPNDLCRRRSDSRQPWAKVGGILCEVRWRADTGRLVIGVGLNLQGTPDNLPAPDPRLNALPAGAIFDEGQPIRADQVAIPVGDALHKGVTQLLSEGFAPFVSRWERFDILAGAAIRVHREEGVRDATVIGIDDAGHLLVRHDDAPGQIQALMAEQVSIRPRDGAAS